MKRKIVRYLAGLMSIVLIFSGCNSNKKMANEGEYAKKKEQQEIDLLEAKEDKMAYGEEEMDFPDGFIQNMRKTKDGKLIILLVSFEEVKLCVLEEDGSWTEKASVDYEELYVDQCVEVMKCGFDDDGFFYLWENNKNEVFIREITFEGEETKNMALLDESGPYKAIQKWYVGLEKAENGDYVIRGDGCSPIQVFDGKTGKLKGSYSSSATRYMLNGNELVYNTCLENDNNIYFYDIQTGKLINTISYDVANGLSNVICNEKGLYLFNSNGIQFYEKQNSKWQTIFKPDDTSFITEDIFICYATVLPNDNFFTVSHYIGDEQSIYLYRYAPSEQKKVAYEKEVTILMAQSIPSIHSAALAYQKEHPEVKVNIETKDNNISLDEFKKQLNAELLSGEGPDMMILDFLPIQTYIDKGVLADIEDVGQKYIDEKQGYSNIINTYKQNGKLYAIPLRFVMPLLCGSEEVLINGGSLENLVAYKQAHPDKIIFNRNVLGLANQFSWITQPILQDEKGKFDRKKADNYIKAIEAISDPEGKNEELEMILCEPYKFSELIDVAEHKAEVTLIEARNVTDLACIDAILDARGDGTVVPVKVDGKVIYNASGIMGINANSKNQEIMKEIMSIALSDEEQRKVDFMGMPPSDHGTELQEEYLDTYSGEIKDDAGRSIQVDNDISRIYETCRESWKNSSLCCTETNTLNVEVLDAIKKAYEEGEDIDVLLDEIEKRQKLQESN